MNKEKLLGSLGELGVNLYDAAVIDEAGAAHKYYQGCNMCNNSYSVAKAFTVTLVGTLWDEGRLDQNARVTDFFPDWEKYDPNWKKVTLDHLMTHTAGYADGFLDIDVDSEKFLAAHKFDDYLELIKNQKIGYEPGTRYAYSDTSYYLLSRIISLVTNEKADDLIRRRITAPMGFGQTAFSRCPNGYFVGGTGLYAAAFDVAKLGFCCLNGGVYEGKRYVSENWVKLVLSRGYEFKPLGEGDLIGKGGLYGQMVLFSPSKGFAAAWHSFGGPDHDRAVLRLLAEAI